MQIIEEEIREVSHNLNDNFSSSKIHFGYVLNQLVENKSHLSGFAYQLNIDKNIIWNNIDEIIKVNLYRIIQEALQNIVKYADAKNVVLCFLVVQNKLMVSVNDDGVGFAIKKKKKGIGIKNMKSRIQKLNGMFSIQSEIGKGTNIDFTIPFH